MTDSYDDIINLPHHVSATRPHMSIQDRAAQFSSFAALTGYDEKIRETARQTQSRIQLTEYQYDLLNEKMNWIKEHLYRNPEVTITYFVTDEKKEGGSYVQASGQVKKVQEDVGTIELTDGTVILLQDILEISILPDQEV